MPPLSNGTVNRNSIPEVQVDTLVRENQPDILERLTKQMHELATVVQTMQYPAKPITPMVASLEADPALSPQIPAPLGVACLES